jgi:hypothetical protein
LEHEKRGKLTRLRPRRPDARQNEAAIGVQCRTGCSRQPGRTPFAARRTRSRNPYQRASLTFSWVRAPMLVIGRCGRFSLHKAVVRSHPLFFISRGGAFDRLLSLELDRSKCSPTPRGFTSSHARRLPSIDQLNIAKSRKRDRTANSMCVTAGVGADAQSGPCA